jgi:hypothetical protein
MFTSQIAAAVKAKQDAATKFLSASDISAALRAGTNFANIEYCVELNTSAANRAVKIRKAVRCNAQLFASIKDYDLYRKQVLRSANKLSESEITEFVVSETYFEHTDCFSIVQHKKDAAKQYLYAIYNRAESIVFVDDVESTKEYAASFMTKSDAAKLLDDSKLVYNKTNDVTHDVTLRVLTLSNIVEMTVNKQVLTVS